DGAAVLVDAVAAKYRYFFTGYSGGTLALTFTAQSWEDTVGNKVTQTQIGGGAATYEDLSGVANRTYIDVTFTPTAGSDGDVSTQQFASIAQAQSFFIDLSGGIILQAADLLDEPLMEVKASVTLEIDTARKIFTLSFAGQLKIIKLGTVGATAGRFVLDTGNSLSSVPQFWGVATLETNFSSLEPYGIFLFGKGTLQVNTTDATKTETLTLPGLGPNGADL